MEGLNITRHESGASGEYQGRVPDSDLVSRLTFVDRDGLRFAEHTLVPPELGGRGIAARLVDRLIADARADGVRIVPDCSYVAAAFQRHPEWSDVLA